MREQQGTQKQMPTPGTMMGFPLTLPTMLERAGKIFPRVEVVSRKPDRTIRLTTYGELYKKARRLASALKKLGLQDGERVASLMWNHSGHLEAFWGVPCAGNPAHAESAAAPTRDSRNCEPRERPFSPGG